MEAGSASAVENKDSKAVEAKEVKSDAPAAPAAVAAAPAKIASVPVNSLPETMAMARDFQSILSPLPGTATKAQVAGIEKSVQGTLRRLDEFSAFVESLRSNSATASTSLIPNLLRCAKQVERLYQRIDDYQEYLNIVEKSVDRMERRVDAVDNAFGGTQLKKFFSSIVTSLTDKPTRLEWKPADFIEKSEHHFS